ncbi:glycosyltransferase family 2 protein [Caldithrix abyssi]|uniref:Glycosyl transferase family 2 n=1 Tax=Caldithrix abyssi DSM 13497 TaxID=880073 RepID=H1XT31_CALAY|nr:glycosyltransferase family 2 protein [Caldithrix abyssi]APF17345.1 Glycosyltransferase involved in cell wall bisynthesis [Caldithrix abyssi DSM 13497]EHO41460.1 glycosyl transferase family 2 [Caldithrix abyssi DSM 13497]
MDLSIVIPFLNEEDSLQELVERIYTHVRPLNLQFELIFIDDGSTDDSINRLLESKKKHPEIKIVRFRKNFGKSTALSEGFDRAQGKIVITMDADLQDDPAEIPNLLKKLDEGYDLVSGWKKKRHDPITKTVPSKLFNFTTRLLTGIKIHDFNCGLKAYRKEVIRAIPIYGELHRYLPVLAHWQGFRVGEIPVKHHARKFGHTKFGARRFLSGFFDLITVLFITRYKHKPMHLFGLFGLINMFFGALILVVLAIQWFQGEPLSRRPLLFLGILLVIVGVQSFSLGLIGDMLTSSKDTRPKFAVKEVIE